MRDDAKGLRKPPLWKGVRRETLVVDGKVRLHQGVREIGIEVRQLLGKEEPFVDHRAATQRAYVEVGKSFPLDRFLDSAPHHIEVAFEQVGADSASVFDHDLFDLGTRRFGLAPQSGDDDRYLPPSVNAMSHPYRVAFDNRATTFLLRLVAPRQEDHSDGKPALLYAVPCSLDMLSEELLRDAEMNSRPVAALAVGVDRTSMRQRTQSSNSQIDDPARNPAVDLGNHPDSARLDGLQQVGTVQAREPCALALKIFVAK